MYLFVFLKFNFQKDAVKTEFLPLPEESNELSTVTTSCLSEEKVRILFVVSNIIYD